MTERERSKDRPRPLPGSPHHVSSNSGSGGLFMGLFGGSKKSTASVSRTSSGSGDKYKQVGKRDSLEELRSPKSLSPHLPPPLVSNDHPGNRAPSPAPFDIQASIAALQPGTEDPARLVDIINSTAAGLYNLHVSAEDLFATQPVDSKPTVNIADIRTLYVRAFAYSQSQLDSQTRTAAIRLLAVLIETHPPATMVGRETKLNLPESINPRSLYYLITAPTGTSQSISLSDAIYVEVGALKALTKNGVAVEGLSGLVEWLSKALGQIQDEWIAWCMQEERSGFQPSWGDALPKASRSYRNDTGRIKVASPGDAAVAIIDLVSAIISSHIALITPSDFDRIINTLINFTIVGINASVTGHADTMSSSVILSRNSSLREPPHTGTTLSSPVAPAPSSAFTGSSMTGSGLLLRTGSTLRRNREDRGTAGSPPTRPSRQTGSPQNITSPRAFPSSALGLRSPSPHALREKDPAKWSRVIPSLAGIFDTIIDKTAVHKSLFKQIIAFVCFCFGQDEEEFVPEGIWEALSDVCGLMLVRKGGWRGQELLREILEGKATLHVEQQTAHGQADRKLARGAVIASRFLCSRIHHGQGEAVRATLSLSSLTPSLRAALSTSRFPNPEDAAKRTEWLSVDMEILALLQDNLIAIEEGTGGEGGNGAIDAWSEGNAACELLWGMLPTAGDAAIRGLSSQRRSSDSPDVPLARFISIFDEVVHLLPSAIGRLDTSSSQDPIFHHPKYIDLLLSLAPVLDEEYAATVIRYYTRECLCLPFTSGWIGNIDKLLQAFFFTAADLPQARLSVLNLLFSDVYSYAREIVGKRSKLMERVILPFMDRSLQQDQDQDFFKLTLRVLVDAAVAETMEKDNDIKSWKTTMSFEEASAEDFAARPGERIRDAASTGYFARVREIIIRIATQTPCKSDGLPPAHQRASMLGSSPLPPPAPTPSSSNSGVDSPLPEKRGRGKDTSSTLRGLMDALSPQSKSRDITPASSNLASPTAEMDHPSLEAAALSIAGATVLPPAEHASTPPPSAPHAACKSSIAVTSLMSMFLHLAFAQNTTTPLSAYAAPARCPSTMRCIAVFQDLLDLLYPMTDDGGQERDPNTPVKIPARCPKARLNILQLLVRLRADSRHQIYLFNDLDKSALPYATILKRTLETEAEKRTELEVTQRKASARQAARGEAGEDRGRPGRTSEPSNRSRSRSTQPLMLGSDTPSQTALWHIPDQLAFTVPSGIIATGGIATYDPTHPLVKESASTEVEGTWLPTSRYIRAINGIFRGHDWELTSYILTFLPLQITNKLFFHGIMSTKEIRSLLEVLCNGVLGIDSWERRYNLPAYIKRVDINAAAYHTLSILIAYRGLFSRAECDRLVQAFMTGLQGKGDVAKPCIQALGIAVFELESSVSRNLLEIVRAMISILTTTGLAVHILEFLISLGQNGAIFRNFTDEQYRLVFRVAITYITEHNARSDQTIDLTDPSTREGYVLSQHVIGLAYYAIYIWFMALRLPQRPNLVSEITRELLKGRSQRLKLDEMAEVCFDWLARYTYGNADPKPSTSFLSEIVMEEDRGEKPKSQSWLLGGCIVTVTSHSRTGWATITSTRPTGSTGVICKLENVPHLDLGEANADLVSLPAVLMANRDAPKRIEGDHPTETPKEGEDVKSGEETPDAKPEAGDDADVPDVRDIVKVQSTANPASANFDPSSQHGYIWSGATPSQRRKDVAIDPSYIAIQLLSSYPNTSLDAPRGRLIPNEDRFSRALRMIQNTPVIDTLKIAVLYIARGQTKEQDILSNNNGPQLYLDFLAGLGRLIRLKGQVDVFVGGLNRDNDSDGEYAYAWWDDLSQMIFHTPSMMPNTADDPQRSRKKRLVGNDMIKIIYNNSGKEFAFDTIKTEYNWINIVISPLCTAPGEDEIPVGVQKTGWRDPESGPWAGQGAAKQGETWLDWDREDWFKVTLQRADGIPDFSPIGTHKLVSKKTLPVLVRHMAHLANDMAARYVNVRDATTDAAKAEYITSWRSRLRAMERLRQMLPPIELPPDDDIEGREQLIRDFTRIFTYRPAPTKE